MGEDAEAARGLKQADQLQILHSEPQHNTALQGT